MKPVEETVASFTETAFDLTKEPLTKVIDIPLAYMLECQVKFDPTSRFAISFGETLHFSLMANGDPNRGQLSLEGSEKDVIRPCPIERSKPTKIQAFVDEMLIEVFVNDQFVQTSIPNIWRPTEGTLKFTSEGGQAAILSTLVKVHR